MLHNQLEVLKDWVQFTPVIRTADKGFQKCVKDAWGKLYFINIFVYTPKEGNPGWGYEAEGQFVLRS